MTAPALRPLILALLSLGTCQTSLAAISIQPEHVPVGKASELSIHIEHPERVQSIRLQAAYPHLSQRIDLRYPPAGYQILRSSQGIKLMDQKGQLLAEFGDARRDEPQAGARFRTEGGQDLVAYKRHGWVHNQRLGRYHSNQAVEDVSFDGPLALLATGQGGLTVLDISDAAHPLWLGSHQKLGTAIKLSSNHDQVAVLNDAGIIYLLDLKNPKEPTTINAYRATRPLHDIYLAGDTLYALGDDEIQVIDFSIRGPQISNEGLDFGQGVNLGGERRVYIDNQIAYVADWFSGLHIYDISRPRQPELLSSYHTPGSPKGIVVRDGIAYVPDDDHGLSILDVSDPLKPRHISTLLTEGLAYTPRLVGDLLYLASHRGGFQIIDVSDASHPVQLSEVDTAGKAWSLAVRNQIAYIADDDQGLLVFDVSDPRQPVQIGQYNTGAAAEEVLIRDNIAFVAYYDDGLHILDISDPRQPRLVAQLALPGNARGLDLVGDTLYVAGWLAGVHAVDVSKLKQPRLLGSYDTRGATWGLKVLGQHLFAMDWWGGIAVIDVSEPEDMRAVGGYHERGRVEAIATRGNYAYVAQGSNGLQVFDIKNPLNPTWTTGASLPGQARAIELQGERAYIAAGDGGLAVMDISNPFNVRWLGSYDSRGELQNLLLDGDTAYASDSQEGLIMLDISQTLPRKIGHLAVNASALKLHQGRLYLATDEGLKIAEYRHGRLMIVDEYRADAAQQLSLDEQHIYLASGRQLKILSLAQPAHELARLTLEDPVTDLTLTDQGLLLSTSRQLLNINTTGQIMAEYPLLTDAQAIRYHQGTVYISGGETIAALRPLADISLAVNGQSSLQLPLPADLGIGNYTFKVRYNDGSETVIDDKLRVEMPSFSKPKLTMEDFKRLMEQQKNSDIFVKPEHKEDAQAAP